MFVGPTLAAAEWERRRRAVVRWRGSRRDPARGGVLHRDTRAHLLHTPPPRRHRRAAAAARRGAAACAFRSSATHPWWYAMPCRPVEVQDRRRIWGTFAAMWKAASV